MSELLQGTKKNDSQDVIQQQIEAYNSQNLQKLIEFYDENICVYIEDSKEPLIRGKEQLKQHYLILFLSHPELHAKVIDRKVELPIIMDRELITGRADDKSELQMDIHYKVVQDKIVEFRVYKADLKE